MIVLDTNVLSELMRPAPVMRVVDWVDRYDPAEVVITAITAAELRAGVSQLPSERRRSRISEQVEHLLADTFAGYVLPFDVDSSVEYADVVAQRKRDGTPIAALDAQIAAICRQHQATLATRNARDFAATGIDVIDPWVAD
jgi:toxin FitB